MNAPAGHARTEPYRLRRERLTFCLGILAGCDPTIEAKLQERIDELDAVIDEVEALDADFEAGRAPTPAWVSESRVEAPGPDLPVSSIRERVRDLGDPAFTPSKAKRFHEGQEVVFVVPGVGAGRGKANGRVIRYVADDRVLVAPLPDRGTFIGVAEGALSPLPVEKWKCADPQCPGHLMSTPGRSNACARYKENGGRARRPLKPLPACEGCAHPRHYGRRCGLDEGWCGCVRGRLLVAKVLRREDAARAARPKRKFLFEIGAGMTSSQKMTVVRAMGRILPGDIGKRVYLVDGVVQVENDEQRVRREGREEVLRREDAAQDEDEKD